MAQDDGPESRGRTRRARRTDADDDEPVLPAVTSDERGESWGERGSERSDDWYLRERPPHHE
jgi:hypothetical protein